jgi:ABC-type multidrug transport system ATPase subunit
VPENRSAGPLRFVQAFHDQVPELDLELGNGRPRHGRLDLAGPAAYGFYRPLLLTVEIRVAAVAGVFAKDAQVIAAQRAAVRLSRVTRLFDGLAAVSDASLEIGRGERVWLRGSNGSGKTTLVRLIATAISPTFGGGTVLGFDLENQRSAIRARTELLSHETRLYGDLTAVENLRFACSLYAIDQRLAEPALERVGLGDVAAVRAAKFSQGMRQRLALARCLMRAPALMLLDEPYAGLDVDARIVVDELLTAAPAAGQTVVVASHEAPPAHLIGREVTMDGGRVVPPAGVAPS